VNNQNKWSPEPPKNGESKAVEQIYWRKH